MYISSSPLKILSRKPAIKSGESKDSHESGAEKGAGVLGMLRDIRVHSQDLLRCVGDVKVLLALVDREAQQKQWPEVLGKNRPVFERDREKVLALLRQIHDAFENDGELYNGIGDEVSQVADLWDRVMQNWPGADAKLAEVAAQLPEIENWLREVIWHCGFVTIPPRVNEHLSGLRPGQMLDFHKNFMDELPDKKDRDEVLRFLKAHPRDVEGITDVELGVIYRVDHNPKVRRKSLWHIVGLLFAGVPLVGLACLAGDWLNLSGWPAHQEQLRACLIAYAFVLLGSFLHVVIAAFKQARSGAEQPFTALEDFGLWIHVKELPIMGGIVSVWFGLFGMVFLGKLPDWQTALFVGYGIDSVVDVVLQRFEAAVPKKEIKL